MPPRTVDTRAVLVCEGGHGFSRGAVATVRALAAAGYRPTVTVSAPRSLAASSRHCARRVRVPSTMEDPAGFAAAVRREAESRPYAAILPANDDALTALDWPVGHLLDKSAWTPVAASLGIAVPSTRLFEDADALQAASAELEYPVVVKPDTKRYPARRVDSASALARVPRDGRVIVQPYVRDAMRGMLGLLWQGRLVAAVHFSYLRIWPIPCGTASAALTTTPDAELEERAPALLEGYDGIFHLDLAGPYLLDVNPRVHATVALAVAAGVNLPDLYCDLVAGRDVATARGRPGVFFRWLEGDIRSVLHAVRRGALPFGGGVAALWPRRGEVHGFESLRDPGPLLERAGYGLRRSLTHRRQGDGGRPTAAGGQPRFTD
jgi:predicted ATP-grasp superfamily ATP-dependent carboligase